jgi:hypothetical protein
MLMPIYALLIVFYIPAENGVVFSNSLYFFSPPFKSFVLTVFILLGVIAPSVSFLYLRAIKAISSLQMEDKNERLMPLCIMLLYCLILYFSFFYVKNMNIHLPKYIQALAFSGAVVSAVFIFVNYKMKISLHAGGAGIFTGYLIAYLMEQIRFEFWIVILAFMISGIIMSSRLYLNKHTHVEIYSGWIIALFITFSITYYYP